MKTAIYFLFLILLAGNVFAFDCGFFDFSEECDLLKSTDEELIANLIYKNTTLPNHDFVFDYNSDIDVDYAPEGTSYHTSGIIQNAWFDILTIMPSVKYQNITYIPSTIQVRSEYDYEVSDIPSNYYNNHKCDGCTCKILYDQKTDSASVNFYAGTNPISSSKSFWVGLSRNTTINGQLDITASYRTRIYEWDSYCCRWRNGRCRRYCYDCDLDSSQTNHYSVSIKDSENVSYYNHNPSAGFSFISQTRSSTKGNITKDNETSFSISFIDSFYDEKLYDYNAVFLNKPYYFLQLEAVKTPDIKYRNLLRNENTLYVKNVNECSITASDFFKTEEFECNTEYQGEEVKEFEVMEFSNSWNLLFKIIVFIFINLLVYTGIKKSWGKIFIPVSIIFLLMPSALADDCGLTNLASCIPEKIYDFFIDILNAPLEPLLALTRSLMENPPSIEIFYNIWGIMVYCVSLFYGLLFIYSGFQFLMSGHNVLRREMAKEWLKNTVIMIVLIQASFYLYQLILELGSMLTASILSMVPEEFFLITADNIVNIGLEFLFLSFYALALFLTILLLLIRYLVVAFGVIYVPIGIFCYFIPPLRSYGKLILHMLGTFIFITFIDAIIILACSMLIELPLFASIKILIMISCFTIINTVFLIMIIKVTVKAVFSSNHGDNIAQAVKYIAMLA